MDEKHVSVLASYGANSHPMHVALYRLHVALFRHNRVSSHVLLQEMLRSQPTLLQAEIMLKILPQQCSVA